MGDITINQKNVITQSGTAEPVLASNVTGGSGLTALGTVTAGNLSNSAIVYPAGHVIQTINEQITGAYLVANGGSTEVHESSEITKLSGSKWLILVTANIGGASDITFRVQHKLSSGGSYSNTFSHNTPNNSVAADLFSAHHSLGTAQGQTQSTSGCSMVGAYSGTYIRFKCFIGSRGGGGSLNRRIQDNNWGGHSFLTLFEIAQ